MEASLASARTSGHSEADLDASIRIRVMPGLTNALSRALDFRRCLEPGSRTFLTQPGQQIDFVMKTAFLVEPLQVR